MARPRTRAALLAGAVLATSMPLVALAYAPHLQCGVKQTGRWERIAIRAFQPVPGLQASQQVDTVRAYTVDENRPQDLAATNGATVQLTQTNGCSWTNAFELSPTPTAAQPFAGVSASIVSVALLNRRVMAAVQDGTGSASRPHVLVSASGNPGTWTTSDSGLPAQGSPRLLRVASDNRTAYLTISPTSTGGSDSGGSTGIIPGLPGGGPVGGTPTGFLYRTIDGGANWTLQTGAGDLPGGGTGFTQLDIDAGDSNRLYGIVGGRLLTSRDGGGTFTAAPGSGYTAVTAMGPLTLAAFTSTGEGRYSANGGATYASFRAPSGVTSAAYRSGDSGLLVESSGTLRRVETNGLTIPVPAFAPARTGSLLGDRSDQASFHALAGHNLLRYVDVIPKGVTIPPLAVGDLTVPPPNAGVVLPAVRNVSLPVGTTSLEDFTLDLPKNPTPLDLYFLVDVSSSMGDYIDDLKGNINKIVDSLKAARVDLKVGVGILGTGAARGETEYPDHFVYPPQADPDHPGQTKPGPTYVKPVLYKRLRAVGDTGPALRDAIDRLTLETVPPLRPGQANNHEGQLIALKNAINGLGTQTAYDETLGINSFTNVPPGQEAGFRPNPGVRRVIVLATNEAMDAPYGKAPQGTDERPGSNAASGNPLLDFGPTINILNNAHVQVFGLTVGVPEAAPDLETLARGTHTFAPPGGVSCGGDPPQDLAAGAPLVCNNADGFSTVITRVLASLVDRQNVRLVPHTRTPVLGALDGRALLGLDVKKPNSAAFQVRVSCVDVKPGGYRQDVDAILRQTVVGKARINVTCVKANGLRPRPLPLGNPPPPPAQPVANVAPPVAPPPPAAQPQAQPQVQTQVQIQPLTAAAMQEQQELQLALALNGTLKDDDPVFNAGQQMAMVDRRRRDEVQALGVLAFAITACGGLGLARLRTRPQIRVRRAQ